jgi:hypothetical protein
MENRIHSLVAHKNGVTRQPTTRSLVNAPRECIHGQITAQWFSQLKMAVKFKKLSPFWH